MTIWSAETKELEKLYESFRGQIPDLEKELERLLRTDDENIILVYSRRCLEVIITDLCECELKRPRKTEPLKGIIDKLNKEEKVPSNIITSMDHLNSLSAYGAHPKDFDPEQVKPVLVNLDIIIKWYLKYKESKINITSKSEEVKDEVLVSDDTAEKIEKSKKRLILLLSGLTLVVAVVVVVLFVFDIIGGGSQIKYLEKSIAVLPFRNESTDQENSAFVNGLMEKILNNLQLIKDFRVISRTSVEQYRDQNKPIPEIAKELGVNYIVEGSAQKYGNAFSLSVQLIKADKKEDHLWGRSFEQDISEVDDILKIQSEIAQAIARELEANISTEERQLIDKIPTINLTALDFYQQGMEEYWRYWNNPYNLEALEKADNLYNKALEYDPAFGQAYLGLAQVYWDKNYIAEYLTENFMDSALVLANTALDYDDGLAEAYALRGDYYREKGYSEQALKEYDKAIDINPNAWQAYMGRANLYIDIVGSIDDFHKALSLGRGRELPNILERMCWVTMYTGFLEIGQKYNQERLKITNDSSVYYSLLGRSWFWLSNLEDALKYYQKAYMLDSMNIEVLFMVGILNGYIGQYEESLLFCEKWLEQLDKTLVTQFRYNGMQRVGYAYWKNNRFDEANYYFDMQMKYCNGAINGKARKNAAYYDRAGIYAFKGEQEKAYEDLRVFINEQSIGLAMVNLFKIDPLFNSLRKEPEFQQIVHDVEAKYQAEHERVRKWLEDNDML